MNYTEEYYKTNNYINYTERKDRYKHLANELSSFLNSISYGKDRTILDYGCALGYLIDGFNRIGHINVEGYDISEYCISECKKNNISIVESVKDYYDIIIALDVFEHMSDYDITDLLFEKTSSDILIGRIPVALDHKGSFHLEVSRNDPTHINCKTKHEWKKLIKSLGYYNILHLNLFSIYDSNGVFSFIAFKD